MLETFRTGVHVVGAEIPLLPKLVGPKGPPFCDNPAGFLLDQFQVATRHLSRHGGRQLIHQNDLRAQRCHHPGPFNRVPAGHHGDKGILLDPADNRQSGPRIATGKLDDRLARLERARRLRILDHLAGNAILLGKARIEILQLGEDAAFHSCGHPGQLHERCLADGFHGGAQDTRRWHHLNSSSLLPCRR
ncbi:MAG: hypothetical protein M5U01_28830 [Ardenticatenaceae bacterium]|nr:hypothetical protein [Ardenticatenaceae bacterium]